MSASKDIKKLSSLAREQGWTVEPARNGHLKWTPPDAQPFQTTSHPKHGRGYKNVVRALERRGLRIGTPGDELDPVTTIEYDGAQQPNATDEENDLPRTPNPLHAQICTEVLAILQDNPGQEMSVDKLVKRIATDADYGTVSGALSKACHTDSRRITRGEAPRYLGLVKVPHRASVYVFDPKLQQEMFGMAPPVDADATVAPDAPPAAPTASETPVAAPALPETTDDELWTLLEMVLDGPVPLTRDTMTLVNKWMDATRELKALMAR